MACAEANLAYQPDLISMIPTADLNYPTTYNIQLRIHCSETPQLHLHDGWTKTTNPGAQLALFGVYLINSIQLTMTR